MPRAGCVAFGSMQPTNAESTEPGAQRGRRRIGGAGVLLCVAVASVVAAVAAFALYRPVPPSLVVAATPAEIQLVPEELTDAREVELSAQLGAASSLIAPAAGAVTSSGCTPGARFVSGASDMVIEQTRLVNLFTTTPLWRDLAFGDKGDDVSALQHELTRLGFATEVTGRFDWQTWARWDDLVEARDGDTTHGELARGQVLWLPAAEVMVTACPVPLGNNATQGEALVTLATPLLAASVKTYPHDLAPGARKLVVGDGDGDGEKTELAIDESGRLTAEGLSALMRTAAYAKYVQNPTDEVLQAELVLAAPVTVYPVPPSAVAMTSESEGCVAPVKGDPIAVTVVSSKLGRTFIAFAEVPTMQTIKAVAPKGTTC